MDFHCHHPLPSAIVCTDRPCVVTGGLMTCIGLLPNRWTPEAEDALLRLLRADSSLHLGEVGLDRRFRDLVPMERQVLNLKRQLQAAMALGRSVSLHCVQATGPMVSLLESLEFRPYSVLWHGFSGSRETAARLGELKVLVSLGQRTRGPLGPIAEANGGFVLETDYEGSSSDEHSRLLEAVYTRASEELGMSMDELVAHCRAMFRLFNPGC